MRKLRGLLIADPIVIVSTLGFGVVSFLVSLFDHTGRVMHRLSQIWARTLLAPAGVRVRVEGIENIHPERGCVFVANHLSYMDTPVVLANIPVQFRFLAKSGLF